jgi:hypothetical protein
MSINLAHAFKKSSSPHEVLCPAEESILNCISNKELPKTPPIQSLIESRVNDASIGVLLCAEQTSSSASRMDIEYLPPLEQGEVDSQTLSVEEASTEKGEGRKIIASYIETLLKTGEHFRSNGRIHFHSLARAANVNRANLRRAFFKFKTFYTSSPYLEERHGFEVKCLEKKPLTTPVQKDSTLSITVKTTSTANDEKMSPQYIEELLKTGKYFHANKRINFNTLAKAAKVGSETLRYAVIKSKNFCALSSYLQERRAFEVECLEINALNKKSVQEGSMRECGEVATRKISASDIEKLLKTEKYFHANKRINFGALAKAADMNKANLRRALFTSETFYTSSRYLEERHDFEVSQKVPRKKWF